MRRSTALHRALSVLVVTGLLASGAVPAMAAPPEVRSFGPEIDAYSRYQGQTDCIATEQPGVRDFRSLVMSTYPDTGIGNMLRACSSASKSEHQDGRAWDWMVDAGKPTQKAKADELLKWLLATDEHGNRHAMARRFGLMYVIWNGRVWSAYRAEEGWKTYTGWSPHTDHVHFSFGWPGAKRQTTYWTAPSASDCAIRGHALVGDWDGSGRDGVGWWCDGKTKLRSANGSVTAFNYGRSGDVPVVADWDGDGSDTVSVIRDGAWHLNNRLVGGASERSFTYGRVSRGDVPIAGSWVPGGADLPGIIRDREWHLRDDASGGTATWQFIYGRLTAGDLPLSGDWNVDGRDTAGIVREGSWELRNTHEGGSADVSFTYGRVLAGDRPVVGDWTGDGLDTPGIVRDGVWHLRHEHRGGAADEKITFRAP